MNEYRIGFIGAGNMARAIIGGAIEKKVLSAEHICVYDIDPNKTAELKERLHVLTTDSIDSLCKESDIILVAVKPNVMTDVLNTLKVHDKPVVSIAAGWSADKIKNIIGPERKVLRLMPNTPLMVGEGMSVFEMPSSFDEKEMMFIENMFLSLGEVEKAPLKLMDAVTAVSGSGPAYVYMFVEALADAGVLCGLSRDMAIKLAAQTVLGSAKMVLDSGVHPGALKDAVCSPGGTTIEAVKSLEMNGFRGAVIEAVEACTRKSQSLVKK